MALFSSCFIFKRFFMYIFFCLFLKKKYWTYELSGWVPFNLERFSRGSKQQQQLKHQLKHILEMLSDFYNVYMTLCSAVKVFSDYAFNLIFSPFHSGTLCLSQPHFFRHCIIVFIRLPFIFIFIFILHHLNAIVGYMIVNLLEKAFYFCFALN